MVQTKAGSIPFVAIGNEELDNRLGAYVQCPRCGCEHNVINSDPPILQYVACGEETLLVGIEGRRIKWEDRKSN